MAPFPWKRCTSADSLVGQQSSALQVPASNPDEQFMAGSSLKLGKSTTKAYMIEFPGLDHVVAESQALGCISFQLPYVKAPAGTVLHHAICSLHGIFEKQSPMIFKIGFTHNPSWRWSNSVYGYGSSKDKWEHMIILFLSAEPCGPAMLEAALIHEFGSTYFELSVFLFVAFFFYVNFKLASHFNLRYLRSY